MSTLNLSELCKDKKAWLTFLFYKVGKQNCDLELCGLWKKEDERVSTKWKKFSEVVMELKENQPVPEKYNQRQVLYNEVVLDLEDKSLFEGIISSLDEADLFYVAWDSGSRGCHINLFFDRHLQEEEKRVLIERFFCDDQKAHERTLIAMEGCPHWKTGKPKTLLIDKTKDNAGNFGLNSAVVEMRGNAKPIPYLKVYKSDRSIVE